MAFSAELPDEWAKQFQRFDQLESALREQYDEGEPGVSRAQIMRTFETVCKGKTCWRTPAFCVWAGLRGCCQAGDFFDRWDALAEKAANHG
jgi:hypothetical protein